MLGEEGKKEAVNDDDDGGQQVEANAAANRHFRIGALFYCE